MLFEPFTLGRITLNNRTVMAPLTRSRAGQPGNLPTELNAEHYAQRASAGLIISEGTLVSDVGRGYLWTPGISTPEQVAGWKRITDAVHGAGGRIFAQLWHCGRISHRSLQPEGGAPVGPTDQAADVVCFALDDAGNPAQVPCSPPHALTEGGIAEVVAQFGRAAENAIAAGFDGVEVHGANGYLLDQFLNTQLNTRRDAYGGSLESRARLLLEAVDAAIAAAGADRVGVRLSPHGTFNDLPADPEADAMTHCLASALGGRGIAYLHFVDPVFNGYARGTALLLEARERFGGPVIACGDMTREKAERYLNDGYADLIAFGRLFIANPDLPRRLELNAPLNEPDSTTFYGGGAEGYTDYPALD